jgi:hypothetical protein
MARDKKPIICSFVLYLFGKNVGFFRRLKVADFSHLNIFNQAEYRDRMLHFKFLLKVTEVDIIILFHLNST